MNAIQSKAFLSFPSIYHYTLCFLSLDRALSQSLYVPSVLSLYGRKAQYAESFMLHRDSLKSLEEPLYCEKVIQMGFCK